MDFLIVGEDIAIGVVVECEDSGVLDDAFVVDLWGVDACVSQVSI